MNPTVLILGGGLAGITAALRLSAQGCHVTVVESGPQLGGRLVASRQNSASPASADPDVARFPLVLFGCHTATWSLLDSLGTAEQIPRQPSCALEFLLTDGRRARLSPSRFPATLHVVRQLLGFRGLAWKDRWRLLNFLERTWENETPLPSDLESRTAAEWLAEIGQSQTALHNVWNPLSRFLLGDRLDQVSASMWMITLRRHYLTQAGHASVFVSSPPIDTLVLDPALRQLTQAGVRLQLDATATQLRFNQERVIGIQLQDGSALNADWYVVALPYDRLQSLLPERIVTRYATFEHLRHLRSVPALTVQMHVKASLQAPRAILLAQGTFHWMLLRPTSSRDGSGVLVTLTSVGNHEWLAQSDEQILIEARRELAMADPSLDQATRDESLVMRSPGAFLSMEPGSRPYRPSQQTPFDNLLLAGDWTDTGWPSSVESAILSGNRCAELIAGLTAGIGGALTTVQAAGRKN